MKSVLLIGLGRPGWQMAEKLQELRHEVLAVDRERERVNDALPLVTNAQIGDGTSGRSSPPGGAQLRPVRGGHWRRLQSSLETTALLKDRAPASSCQGLQGCRQIPPRRNGADGVVYPEKQMAAGPPSAARSISSTTSP